MPESYFLFPPLTIKKKKKKEKKKKKAQSRLELLARHP